MQRFNSRFIPQEDYELDLLRLIELVHSARDNGARQRLKKLLTFAINKRWGEAVDLLITLIEPEQFDPFEAVRSGSLDLVKRVFRRIQDFNFTDDRGRTPLRFAETIEIARYLLCEGADPNKFDDEGIAAIHRAVALGHQEYLDLLLNFDAEVRHTNLSPLAVALSAQVFIEDIAKSLLMAGADPNDLIGYHSYKDIRVLHLCFDMDIDYIDFPFCWFFKKDNDRYMISLLHLAVLENHLEGVKLLIRFGARIINPPVGKPTLFVAALNGNVDMLQAILSLNPDPKDEIYKTLFNELLTKDHNQREKLLMLWDHGFRMDINPKTEAPLLTSAIRAVNLDFIKFRLAGDFGIHDATNLADAVLTGKKEILLYILPYFRRRIDRLEALRYAICSDRVEMAKILIDEGVDIREDGDLLHLAVRNESYLSIKLLLQLGLPIDSMNEGLFPLHEASSPAMAKFLILSGAKLDVKTSDGKTALARAYEAENNNLYKTFRAMGSNQGLVSRLKSKEEVFKTVTHPMASYGLSGHLPEADSRLNALLDEAIRGGCRDIVVSLLVRGARPTRIGLFQAVASGSAIIVDLVLKLFANDVNSLDSYGRAALHYAKTVEIAELLLERGADPNITDKNNLTPLVTAVSLNNWSLLNVLLDYGADAEIKIAFNWTPLALAITNSDYNHDIVTLLLASGADPNSEIAFENNFKIRYLIRQSEFNITSNESPTNICMDVAESDRNDVILMNLLHVSALVDKLSTVNTLKRFGAKIKNPSVGRSTLSVAIAKGNFKLVEALLAINPDIQDDRHKLSLNEALLNPCPSQYGIVRLLTEYGFSIQPDSPPELLTATVKLDRHDLVKARLALGLGNHDPDLLSVAVEVGNEQILRTLLPFYTNLTSRYNAFHVALKQDNLPMAKLLMNNGVDPEIISGLLHSAVKANSYLICEFFLQSRFDPNAFHKNRAPLHEAKSPQMVRLLLAYGAQLYLRTPDTKKSPMELAYEDENRGLVDLYSDYDKKILLMSIKLRMKKEKDVNNFQVCSKRIPARKRLASEMSTSQKNIFHEEEIDIIKEEPESE